MVKIGFSPKIELHCHLDGSLRPETVLDLYQSQTDQAYGDFDLNMLKNRMMAPVPCMSLDMYLKTFDIPIYVMQTHEAIERVSFELMEDAYKDGVKYIEIRFAPLNHMAKGLSLDQVLQAAIDGVKRGEETYDIKGNIILSYMRHEPPQGLIDLVHHALKFLNQGVVAVDLCGSENDRFSSRFESAIQVARDLGYHVTIHAGETGSLENILDAVTILKAERIGHGTALIKSMTDFDLVASAKVTLECCPTSNLQTKAVRYIEDHPIDIFLEKGLSVTLNTDNRTVSDTTMTKELDLLVEAFKWHDHEAKKLYANAIEASFASSDIKHWLKHFL